MVLYFIFTLLVVAHLLILFNLQFTAWPEMLSYPYLLNNDFALYRDQVLPYQPLLILILSKIYAIFGYDIFVLKIFTWVIILINDLLIFLISRKIIKNKILIFLPLLFYVMTQPFFGGNMLWFDLATVPFILGASYLLISLKKYLFVGVLLGLASLTKQQMLVLPAVLIIYFIIRKNFNSIKKLLIGFLIPWMLIWLWVISQGILNDYIFWTFTVPFFWYPRFPGYSNWPTNMQILQTIILFSGIFLVIKNFHKWSEITWILFLTFATLFLTAFPRFDYFRMQPTLAILPVLFVASLKQKISVSILILSALLFLVISWNNIIFGNQVRFYDQSDLNLSEKMKKFLKKEDKVYLLGIQSGQYVFTQALPPKPWVDNYIWYMEITGIQDKVVASLNLDKPKYIFWKAPQRGQWFEIGTYQPLKITNYIKGKYQKIDVVEGVELWQRN